MPIYEYECPKCGEFEHRQSLHDPTLKKCPTCRSKVTKLISATAFQLKGGGWYSDAYQKKGASKPTTTTTETASAAPAATTPTPTTGSGSSD